MPDLDEKLLDEGTILLNGTINEAMYQDFQKKIMYMDSDDAIKEIHIIINSDGGNLRITFAICDYIGWARARGKKIRTVSLGSACSGGFFILISGDKRVITKNTMLLGHRFVCGKYGNQAELIATRKMEDITHDRMIEHIKKHTKLKTKKRVEEIALKESDAYFTPEEALKYGFVDQVIGV